MNISERIDALIKALKMTKNSFSIKIGMDNNVTIGRIIKENREPSYQVLSKIILTFSNVNANWLLSGIGNMFLDKNESGYKCHECKNLTEELIKAKNRIMELQDKIMELQNNEIKKNYKLTEKDKQTTQH